jgi:NAD(P)H-hydrate epimerase
MQFVTKSLIKKIYKKRPEESHKGDFGNLLIIGGSKIYSGSPALVALAAIRSGADLTCIAAPERAADITAGFSPDLITLPLKGDYFETKHLKEMKIIISKYDAVTIGNGMCGEVRTKRAVLKFLKNLKIPCVIDADAIRFITGHKGTIKQNFVLTPHGAEFQKLTGIKVIGKKLEEKIKAVESAARKLNCTILLKGNTDIISDGKKTILNKTGSPLMTKGGTGDTLTGILGALMARGVEAFDAASAAAYINGLAGEFAAKKYGEGLMASDLIDEIPDVLK